MSAILSRYWAKSKKENGLLWHPALCHALDAAAVATVWLTVAPGVRRGLCVEIPFESSLMNWVPFFVYLHDYGKLDTRFQALNRELLEALNPDLGEGSLSYQSDEPYYHHGEGGKRLFDKDLNIDIDRFDELDIDEHIWNWVKDATYHHDFRSQPNEKRVGTLYAKPNSSLDLQDRAARQEFFEIGFRLFLNQEVSAVPADSMPLPPVPPTPLFAGFCSVCDWLASNTLFFPFERYPDDLQEYYRSRLPLAKEALQQCGLIAERLQKGGMAVLFPQRNPRGIQRLEVKAEEAGTLVLMEASTGSGKTEAALAVASCWITEGRADSIIFALPTQATANAMFSRIQAIAGTLFPGTSNVVLAHGKAAFNEGFLALKKRAEEEQLRAEEIDKSGAVQCSQWLGSSKKRALLGQICICTVDQVLMSVLPIRHSFIRTLAFGRSVLIIDEVHSYSPYMNVLIKEVLKKQAAVRGHTILLSATLPQKQKENIFRSWCASDWCPGDAYPLVTLAAAGGTVRELTCPFEEKSAERCVFVESLRLKEALPDEALYAEIIASAVSGQAVVLICNLVQDAQMITRELMSRTALPVDLFHARFTFHDRDRIEREVVRRYGPERIPGEGRILVATQVVEQSLDLDFDRMYTQICPVDLLFQRIGRLHRHLLPRRADTQARCVVLSPLDDDFALHGFIYRCAAFLWRTRRLVEQNMERENALVRFPGAYRPWVDAVYADSFPEEPQSMTEAYAEWEKETLVICANAHYLTQDEGFIKEERAACMTRDGEMSLSLLPIDTETQTLCDDERTPLPSDLSQLSAHESVQMQLIHCPASWEGFFAQKLKYEDGIYLLPVTLAKEPHEARRWTARLKNATLHYDRHLGLWKE